MDTGFNYYHDADPGEYDLIVANSEGGLERLRELGARRTEAIFWGADPDFFRPYDVEKEADVFFYGYGDKFRREWMEALVGEPSRELPDVDFALGGRDFLGDTGRARMIGDVPFNVFPQAISAARINLCITRRSHASVYASSSARPFELASCAAAMWRTLRGIERWFEPGASCSSCMTQRRRLLPTTTCWTTQRKRRARRRARTSPGRTHLPSPRTAAAGAHRHPDGGSCRLSCWTRP